MHILTAGKKKIELELLHESPAGLIGGPPALGELGTFLETSSVARASRAFFRLGGDSRRKAVPALKIGPPPAVFREKVTGRIRTVYREIVLRFHSKVTAKCRRQILKKYRFELRRVNPFFSEQIVVADSAKRRIGAQLFNLANDCSELDEVVFATPNFVSEYRRHTVGSIPSVQWHLRNLAKVSGQKKGEDVDAYDAWKITPGKAAIVVAIVDDGVDVEQPYLRSRIWTNPKEGAKDRIGRDFFLPDDHPDHYNPRPKKFQYPYNEMTGNDIHGTPCAGVAAAAGTTVFGIAPRCRILPVKIFHGDDLAQDERVADAIRYAAQFADVISCSWSGPRSTDLELAIADASRGRNELGAAIFCASGNEGQTHVDYPASDPNTIAIGASTDQGNLAWYSNTGPEIDLVAPSDGGKEGIFTTDVSYEGRGFNIGTTEAGGKDGRCTNDFGGTSSATPLAAGVGALALSVNRKLSREELRDLLRATADKIGTGYDPKGHSSRFGYGRVNAARAVMAAKHNNA